MSCNLQCDAYTHGVEPLQVYQSPAKALHLWFEAASHGDKESYGQAKMWGGLWTATSAEAFAANAVSMYTSEDTWCDWQRVGSSLVDQLYGDTRLQIVKASHVLHLPMYCAHVVSVAAWQPHSDSGVHWISLLVYHPQMQTCTAIVCHLMGATSGIGLLMAA